MVDIREFDLQNVMTHYKWNNDPKLNYYDSDYPYQPESFEAFLRRIRSVVKEDNKIVELFEIYLSKNNKLIGIVDLHSIDRYNRRCYMNCTIGDQKFKGQGYETKAMKKVLRYCFDRQGMQKVSTTAFDFNTAWIDSIYQIGFRKEGRLRKHVFKSDTFCDKLIFGLLKSEYESARDLPQIVAAE